MHSSPQPRDIHFKEALWNTAPVLLPRWVIPARLDPPLWLPKMLPDQFVRRMVASLDYQTRLKEWDWKFVFLGYCSRVEADMLELTHDLIQNLQHPPVVN